MSGLADAASMVVAPNGLDLYAGGSRYGGIWTSADSGVTWRKIVDEPYTTYHLAVAPSHPSTIYRITSYNNVEQAPTVLFRSDDSGRNWTRLQWPGESSCCPRPLVVDPLDSRSVWIGVLHSTDAGATWSNDANLPYVTSESIAADGTAMFAISNGASGRGRSGRATPEPFAGKRFFVNTSSNSSSRLVFVRLKSHHGDTARRSRNQNDESNTSPQRYRGHGQFFEEVLARSEVRSKTVFLRALSTARTWPLTTDARVSKTWPGSAALEALQPPDL